MPYHFKRTSLESPRKVIRELFKEHPSWVLPDLANHQRVRALWTPIFAMQLAEQHRTCALRHRGKSMRTPRQRHKLEAIEMGYRRRVTLVLWQLKKKGEIHYESGVYIRDKKQEAA